MLSVNSKGPDLDPCSIYTFEYFITCATLLTTINFVNRDTNSKEKMRCMYINMGIFRLRGAWVLWRNDVILRLCSQNSQAEWIRNPVGPQHLSVIATSVIPPPGAKNRNFTFTFTLGTLCYSC